MDKAVEWVGKRIVVIGGVAAGASSATRARRLDELAEITIFERGGYVSFANCGLPYYLGGVIKDRNQLFVLAPRQFKERYNIDLKTNHEVVRIDRQQQVVEVVNHETGERFEQPYDKLIIATGGTPIVPPIPGIDLGGIFNLWTVPDMDNIKNFMETKNPKTAAVVGGGFVGLETVEALVYQGLKVHLLEASPQIFAPFDQEMTKPLMDELARNGVEVSLSDGVAEFCGQGTVNKIKLASGREIQVDLVVLAVGVRPELTLAKEAGLEIGSSGGLAVNDRMQTSDRNIYAAGDVIEVPNLVTGQKTRVPLAGPAHKQARVAGTNVTGGDLKFKGVIGTSVIKLFELTAGRTGINAREAENAGIDFFVAYTHASSNAEYYPGAEKMSLKLVVERGSGRLLGAQIVGAKGVDKRIDVLATAIMARMTVEDLEDLDLAYAPPYSTAKDAVIIAAYVANNINQEEYKVINNQELAEAIEVKGNELEVIDLRSEGECAKREFPADLQTELENLRFCLDKLDPTKKVVVFCGEGYNSYLAAKILEGHGFNDVQILNGGHKCWCLEMPEKIDKK